MIKYFKDLKLQISSIFNEKTLISNMSWLFILNFLNAIIPYFTFPYITRIFLPEGYGLVSFSLSFMAYFLIVIEYGFNLTGVKKIAQASNENDYAQVSHTFSTIIITKFLLFILVLPLMVGLTFVGKSLIESRTVILILIIQAFSNVIMPVWLFQGLQKVKIMTVISLVIRSIFVVLVFTLIKSPKDINLYVLIYSLSFLLISIFSLIFSRLKFNVKFTLVKFKDIIIALKEGFHVFLSGAVIVFLGYTGTFLLGLFYGNELTGYYSAIDKINQFAVMFFYPIGQGLFPYNTQKYQESFSEGYNTALKFAKIFVPLFAFGSLLMIILRKPLVYIILGPDYLAYANLLLIISLVPTFSILSNFLGTQILVASGNYKAYSQAFLLTAIISIIMYFPLTYYLDIWGVAIASLMGLIFNNIFLYIKIKKVKKSYLKDVEI